jgi:hypothetical protein
MGSPAYEDQSLQDNILTEWRKKLCDHLDVEKASDKTQYTHMVQTVKKNPGIEGNSIISIYWKPYMLNI